MRKTTITGLALAAALCGCAAASAAQQGPAWCGQASQFTLASGEPGQVQLDVIAVRYADEHMFASVNGPATTTAADAQKAADTLHKDMKAAGCPVTRHGG